MNNKYDVKNFSDIIDQFQVKEEVETINKSIISDISEKRKGQKYYNNAYDPVITNKNEAQYQFNQYDCKRYEIKSFYDIIDNAG